MDPCVLWRRSEPRNGLALLGTFADRAAAERAASFDAAALGTTLGAWQSPAGVNGALAVAATADGRWSYALRAPEPGPDGSRDPSGPS